MSAIEKIEDAIVEFWEKTAKGPTRIYAPKALFDELLAELNAMKPLIDNKYVCPLTGHVVREKPDEDRGKGMQVIHYHSFSGECAIFSSNLMFLKLEA